MRDRDSTVKELAELAAGTTRVAAVELEHLAETLERVAKHADIPSSHEVDLVIGELGAMFQIVAGQVEQVRILRAHLDRIAHRT